jgi:uncharacterized coiled-coil protein SlyX
MDDNTTIVNKKNTSAFQQSIEHLNKIVHDQNTKISGLQNTIATLSIRIEKLEQALLLQKAASYGRGPTTL